MRAGVSLVVIHYGDDPALAERLLMSLKKHADRSLFTEITVVDNGGRLDKVGRYRLERIAVGPKVTVVRNEQVSYASGVNAGMRASYSELVAVSNNDVEWLPGQSIAPLIDALADRRAGVAGPQLRYLDGRWQRSHSALPSVGRALATLAFLDTLRRALRAGFDPRGGTPRPVRGYIDGAFMLIRRPCFADVGGFDEDFTFYGEDADFCYRARRAGWRLLLVPAAEVMHIRGASAAIADPARASRLLDAEARVVRRRSGARAARLYSALMALGYAERMLAYGFLARIRPAAHWRSRFELARARYLAARRQ